MPERQTVDDKREWLNEQQRATRYAQSEHAAREQRWSLVRLVTFFVALLPVLTTLCSGSPQTFISPSSPWTFVWLLFPLGVLAFTLAVRMHGVARSAREEADHLLQAMDEAQQRLGGAVVCLRGADRPADADEHDSAIDHTPSLLPAAPTWTLTDQERDDLDLFSRPVGVFGLLNRCSSLLGARRLRDLLENPLLDAAAIRDRQRLLRALADAPDARIGIQGALVGLRGESERVQRLVQAIADAQPLETSAPLSVLRGWAWVSGGLALLGGAQLMVGNVGWTTLLIVLVIINSLILKGCAARVGQTLKVWQDLGYIVRVHARAVRGVFDAFDRARDQQGADVAALEPWRQACADALQPEILPALAARAAWTDHGGPLWVLVDRFTLVRMTSAARVLESAAAHRDPLLRSLSALGDLDALASLGGYAWEQPVTCWPQVSDEDELHIEHGRHPLINPEVAVPNTLHLTEQCRVWVITGSNMAGKSTFLRMVGVNLLLAHVGCAVTAERLAFRPVRLASDLRARDNLSERESYFLAEVRHLRRMVTPPAGPAPLFGLIDEPFRGTNSRDQSAASVAVLRHLLGSGNFFVLATHDEHLTRVVDEQTARNFHFREHLLSDEMTFDYLLREGPAQTRNALRILEIEGYPPELVEHAKAWLAPTGP